MPLSLVLHDHRTEVTGWQDPYYAGRGTGVYPEASGVRYDKNGDNHYDTISAFIKSMRGSDPDAAVYYLARMLYAGEERGFHCQTYHDLCFGGCGECGSAGTDRDGRESAALAVERVGMPEAQIILAQAATYVACCT